MVCNRGDDLLIPSLAQLRFTEQYTKRFLVLSKKYNKNWSVICTYVHTLDRNTYQFILVKFILVNDATAERGIKLLIMRVAKLILGNDFVFDRNQNARPRRVASRRRLVGWRYIRLFIQMGYYFWIPDLPHVFRYFFFLPSLRNKQR